MEMKKLPKANLEKRRPLLVAAGAVVALSLSLVAFEWRTPYTKVTLPAGGEPGEYIDLSDIVPIKIEEDKPKPEEKQIKKILSNDFKIVDKLEEIEEKEEEPVEKVNVEDLANKMFTVGKIGEEEKKEEKEEIVRFPDKMPVFKCMNDAKAAEIDLLNYVQSRIKYPQRAIELGVEGKVSLEFVVDKTGKVKDVKVLKGIGYGCDEEVVRVVKSLPDWCPGYLNNKYCDVYYNLPIRFQLP